MGCGILAFTLVIYISMYLKTETDLLPSYIIYILFVYSLLSIIKKFKSRKLNIGILLSIISAIIYFITIESEAFVIMKWLIYYLHIVFVLFGIVDISIGYDHHERLKKKIFRFLINLSIIIMIAMNSFFINKDGIVFNSPLLILILFIQLCGLCKEFVALNSYLYYLDDPIKINDIKPRTRNKKMIALLILVLSVSSLYFYNENLPWLSYKKENIEFEYYIYSGQSEDIIVDSLRYYIKNKSPLYGDYYSNDQVAPIIYIKKNLFEKSHILEAKIYSPSVIANIDALIKNKESVKYIDKGDYVGIVIDYGLNSWEMKGELENNIDIEVILKNENNKEVYTDKISLIRQSYKEYGYKDENIDISKVYASNNNIVYGPYIYIKDNDFVSSEQDYWVYTTFIIDGKEVDFSKSDYNALTRHLIFKQNFTYAPLEGQTISLRIHYTEPKVDGNEIFYQDYVLEELK